MGSYDETNRPACKAGCGRNAALARGELAYKGFCSRCYKEDVAARRRGGTGLEVVEEGQPAADAGAEPGVAGVQGGAGEADEGGRDRRPGQRIPCGWCLDGNHLARERDEPDEVDELGLTVRRGRPSTWGCAAHQVRASDGTSRGLSCPCADAGHRLGPHPVRSTGSSDDHEQEEG